MYNHLIIEGVHEIKPSVTLDFVSNSPLLYMYKKAKIIESSGPNGYSRLTIVT